MVLAAMDTPEEDNSRKAPSKRFVALLYLPLMIPALIPLFMSRNQEDPVIVAIMVGTSLTVLVANGFFLVLIHRWFARSSE